MLPPLPLYRTLAPPSILQKKSLPSQNQFDAVDNASASDQQSARPSVAQHGRRSTFAAFSVPTHSATQCNTVRIRIPFAQGKHPPNRLTFLPSAPPSYLLFAVCYRVTTIIIVFNVRSTNNINTKQLTIGVGGQDGA